MKNKQKTPEQRLTSDLLNAKMKLDRALGKTLDIGCNFNKLSREAGTIGSDIYIAVEAYERQLEELLHKEVD